MADVVPEGWDSKIMHGSVRIGGKLLDGADVPPERYEKPQWFSLAPNVPNAVEAETVIFPQSDVQQNHLRLGLAQQLGPISVSAIS